MSVHTAHSRNSSDVPSAPSSQESLSPSNLGPRRCLQLHVRSAVSERENNDPVLRSAEKIRDVNCTYVISACGTAGDGPLTPNPVGRLTLQRRVTRNKESSSLGSEVEGSPEKVTETGPRLQRRAGTGSARKRPAVQDGGGAAGSHGAPRERSTCSEVVRNDEDALTASSAPLAEDTKDTGLMGDEKYRETYSTLGGANDSAALKDVSHGTPIGSRSQTEAVRSGHSATKPTRSKLDIRVPGTGHSHHRSIGKDTTKITNKLESLEKRTPTKRVAEYRRTPWCSTPQPRSPAVATPRNRMASFQVHQKPNSSLLADKRERSLEPTCPPEGASVAQSGSAERGPSQVEDSQVTVAVRVRPFSKREKDEDASQVVFLDGDDIAVRHPDLRHVYHFSYDIAFWSFDARHPRYASQAAVYETLAAPLLARALDGYNACLLAYGQTGSGKSYTMMGFGEEPGIIPRFCEDLFAQVAKKQTQQVSYHIEMSFFEVYNEKIHDLLVGQGGSEQRKQPLRVREHPIFGPYVEALAVNAVSSYSDIQGWLQLGAKQRATAATGMNDKSSRSHAVLALVVTRTQMESVDGEQHGHRVTSHINLVDLAGSERCGQASTCGPQLREGVSINKSLLTLGKVISALAEHGSRRRVFIPYRESVLTWLLKESLGGNSKTAMVATVSPAAGSVEETLSTLRYAQQARRIVNTARVNEDASARLVRELKAEIEKLKAAQGSRPNFDPERYRLCRQEITSLRMKLHQQERDMAEMQRAWKQKFEEAERRKHHEMKELQKAGITFQVDNHLPNLVNLSEDPQLSEMLLYVIREGVTSVGRRSPASSPASGPDIQLSGVLVAENHCTIRNVGGTVTITPVGDAKTYVNGKHILEPTALHHGDRLVLGGDHYFRFNHPLEVQKGKRPSAGDALTHEGPKDFEFARNELFAAQRSQLEAEIREAQLSAKQEMLQGIQIAKDLAEQELSSQKAAYESRIEALREELKEESQQKKMHEISNQQANQRLEELEKVRQRLEQEVRVSRRRLEVESLAAQQALEDHSIRHTKILEALEAEKDKLAKEVQALQQSQGNRDRTVPVQPGWSAMKLSTMLQEANAVSSRFHRQYVFSRHEPADRGSGSEPRVRVRNLRLGVCTLWDLGKFESKLAAMKELYESNCGNKSEDLFCDLDDEWEPDITSAPISASSRRSRSLAKSRRVSGYLHDLQAQAAQNSQSSRSSGSMEKSGIPHSSSAESFLPITCKELIGSSLAVLGQSYEEKTVADSLMEGFLQVHSGLLAISQAYDNQDEDSRVDLFTSDRATQARAVQVVCAFGQLAVLAALWLGDAPPGSSTARLRDALRQEVEKLGSYLQLFLQGCCSDISPMVKDAQRKVTEIMQQAVKHVGQLAVLNGSKLRLLENSGEQGAGGPGDFLDAAWDGVGSGVRLLLASGTEKAEELRRELLGQRPRDEVAQQMCAHALAFIACLENIFAEWKTRSSRAQAQGGNAGHEDLREVVDRVPAFLKLQHGLEQTAQTVTSTLRGRRGDGDGGLLRSCVDSVCSMAGSVQPDGGYRLEPVARALLLCFESDERPDVLKRWEACDGRSGEGRGPSRASRSGSGSKGVPKRVYQPPSCPPRSPQVQALTPSRAQWV